MLVGAGARCVCGGGGGGRVAIKSQAFTGATLPGGVFPNREATGFATLVHVRFREHVKGGFGLMPGPTLCPVSPCLAYPYLPTPRFSA